MTTPWQITPDWQGETVAVLASGPNMSAEVAEALRPYRTIAVNFAHRVAPWADMLVALDGTWPQELHDFAGLRVTGIEDADTDALYAGQWWQTVSLAPGHTVEIRNSGLAAIRIAAALGASRIILSGFDPEQPRHFYDDEVDTGEYVGLETGIAALTGELAARGIVVERYTAPVAEPVAVKGRAK